MCVCVCVGLPLYSPLVFKTSCLLDLCSDVLDTPTQSGVSLDDRSTFFRSGLILTCALKE